MDKLFVPVPLIRTLEDVTVEACPAVTTTGGVHDVPHRSRAVTARAPRRGVTSTTQH